MKFIHYCLAFIMFSLPITALGVEGDYDYLDLKTVTVSEGSKLYFELPYYYQVSDNGTFVIPNPDWDNSTTDENSNVDRYLYPKIRTAEKPFSAKVLTEGIKRTIGDEFNGYVCLSIFEFKKVLSVETGQVWYVEVSRGESFDCDSEQ